jgi:hypothetical protein
MSKLPIIIPGRGKTFRLMQSQRWRSLNQFDACRCATTFSFHFRFAHLKTKSGSYRKQSNKRSKQGERGWVPYAGPD